METKLIEVAQRIRALREIMDFSADEMAAAAGVSSEDYTKAENGEVDFGFTFLYKCAEKFGVDIVELLTGENPKLSFYSIVRSGEGLDIKRRAGFKYNHLAYRFRDKISEPFVVTAPYSEEAQTKEIELSTHEGQEFDYVLSGSLKVQFETHTEVLNEGDAVYYDSGRAHGMIATGGKECVFMAVVMKDKAEG
ncbi:MAG: cupin domain-containing protein [Oscillospiraceae bacterium]|jgi:quercetin dioxygenase-like cupin family protein/DNA-binding XRE family transcriptional regulator|nr:cupin domain-containing protein [Oscillospiraceae bacterium]